jgi:phosphoribosylformimino-5-aminoimidazole carboxamide ribotide isomerase
MSVMINQAKIIPVLDILNGIVVRGVAGEREKYKPVSGIIANNSDPLTIASAFHTLFSFDEIYIADLDAITRKGNNLGKIKEIKEQTGMNILLDFGVRSLDDIERLIQSDIDSVVVATETMNDFDTLSSAINKYPKHVIGSLDLKKGMLVSTNPKIAKTNPIEMARKFEDNGLSRLIVLEMSLVGTSLGPIHNVLVKVCEETEMRIVAGGGVRYQQDLVDLYNIGVKEALVATALHKGNIKP